jgi:hypothetical protein
VVAVVCAQRARSHTGPAAHPISLTLVVILTGVPPRLSTAIAEHSRDVAEDHAHRHVILESVPCGEDHPKTTPFVLCLTGSLPSARAPTRAPRFKATGRRVGLRAAEG